MSIFPMRILLATDGSEEATLAATTAAILATRTGSKLHVLTVGPEYPYYELPDYPARFEEVVEAQRREAREVLEEQVKKIEESGGIVKEGHFEMGEPPGRAIVHLGEKLGAGLIVLGSRGLGPLKRVLMGSVSSGVVRHAHCPVLVVRGDGSEANFLPGRILLALDGSEEASAAARVAVEFADRMDSELHVVHVGEVPFVYHPDRHGYLALYEKLQERAQRLLDEQVNEVKTAGGTVAKAHLRMGRPDEEIVVLGEEIGARLIITGSRGKGGIRRALMGSVSDSVVRHTHCSVMVVRKEGRRQRAPRGSIEAGVARCSRQLTSFPLSGRSTALSGLEGRGAAIEGPALNLPGGPERTRDVGVSRQRHASLELLRGYLPDGVELQHDVRSRRRPPW